MKKILCLIATLGSAGAERQMSGLAVMLKKRGYQVEVWYYIRKEFYLPYLEENGVVCRYLAEAESARRRYFVMRKQIKKFSPDVIISFSESTNMISCTMRLLGTRLRLIVSERNTTQHIDQRENLKFFLYRWADVIVPNSQSQGAFIHNYFPHLDKKVKIITNFVNTEKFVPFTETHKDTDVTRIICVGRLAHQKNVLNFIEAVAKVVRQNGDVRFDWFGHDFGDAYAKCCYEAIEKLGLNDYFEFHQATSDVISEYQKSDVFCLPSFYEGFPNVLCEAMSCGLPVLCSNVCDNPYIMKDGQNGFLFDPNNTEDMASKILSFCKLSTEERQNMGKKSLEIAKKKFSKELFIQRYIDIIENEL